MKRRAVVACGAGAIGAAIAVAAAEPPPQGRFEGEADAGGEPVALIVDLVADADAPTALLTLPGRAIQRARLAPAEWRDGRLRAASADGDLALDLRPDAPGRLVGTWRQGGHAAPLTLTRRGEALPLDPGAALAPELAGAWRARYDLGFGARDATLRLEPPRGATMEIAGRRRVEVRFDEVAQRGYLIVLRSSEAGFTIEAPAAGAARGELAATVRVGPFESAAAFRRDGAR